MRVYIYIYTRRRHCHAKYIVDGRRRTKSFVQGIIHGACSSFRCHRRRRRRRLLRLFPDRWDLTAPCSQYIMIMYNTARRVYHGIILYTCTVVARNWIITLCLRFTGCNYCARL